MTHLHKYKETTYFQDEDVIKYILEPTSENKLSLLPKELRKIIVYWTYVKFELQPLTFTKYNEFLNYLKSFETQTFYIHIPDFDLIRTEITLKDMNTERIIFTTNSIKLNRGAEGVLLGCDFHFNKMTDGTISSGRYFFPSNISISIMPVI